ncbi:mutator type transposase, partial [Tanacetum coccineum]
MVVPLYDIRDDVVHDRDPYKMYNCDQFSVHEIDSMLEDLGQDGHRVMFYHFLKPGYDLDNGLEPLACDKDVVLLGNYVTQGLKLVEVFVEHEKTNPDIYTHPKAKRLVIEELEDAKPRISKAWITSVAKKLVLDVNNKQTSGKNLEGQSSGKELEGQSSAVDKNREGNNVKTKGDEERQGEEETEVDEERQGEEEIEVDEERQGEEETEVEDESNSEDSDYLVDEDNNVDDVDVDMEDFEFNIDEEVEFVRCRDKEQPLDIEEGDAEEIEVLDNDYFESASDSDDDGKEFPNKKEVKAYIKEHSIETMREIRLEKNDNERVRAICRGVIPSLPTFKDLCNDPNQGNGPSQGSGPSQASGSKEKWTKGKIAMARSPSKDKLTKEKLINADLVEQLKINPKIPVRAVQGQLQQKHELSVTHNKAFRAKQEAEKKLIDDYTLQYKMLRDYVLELQKSNPNTTVKIHVQSEANHE